MKCKCRRTLPLPVPLGVVCCCCRARINRASLPRSRDSLPTTAATSSTPTNTPIPPPGCSPNGSIRPRRLLPRPRRDRPGLRPNRRGDGDGCPGRVRGLMCPVSPSSLLTDPHCLHRPARARAAGELAADIRTVVSNHPDHRATADFYGVPYRYLPVTPPTRAAGGRGPDPPRRREIDLVVLARYMQVLSDDSSAQYPNRIINIHHSFLPAFVGREAVSPALERGVKVIGATAHYATEELDEGPIIEQDVVRISHRDAVDDLFGRVATSKRLVLSRCSCAPRASCSPLREPHGGVLVDARCYYLASPWRDLEVDTDGRRMGSTRHRSSATGRAKAVSTRLSRTARRRCSTLRTWRSCRSSRSARSRTGSQHLYGLDYKSAMWRGDGGQSVPHRGRLLVVGRATGEALRGFVVP